MTFQFTYLEYVLEWPRIHFCCTILGVSMLSSPLIDNPWTMMLVEIKCFT